MLRGGWLHVVQEGPCFFWLGKKGELIVDLQAVEGTNDTTSETADYLMTKRAILPSNSVNSSSGGSRSSLWKRCFASGRSCGRWVLRKEREVGSVPCKHGGGPA